MKLRIALLLLLCRSYPLFGQTTFPPVALAFPQIAVGGDAEGQNYSTLIQLVNDNSASVSGHIAALSDGGTALSVSFDGGAPQASLDVVLAPSEFRQIELTLSGAVTAGWLVVSYAPAEVLTTVILRNRVGSTLVSEVGVDPAFSPILGADFAIDADAALNTGVALANASTAQAFVLARLFDPATGAEAARTIISLPGNGHIARFVTEMFPNAFGLASVRAKVSLDSCSSSTCTFAGGNGFLATALRTNGDQFTTIPVTDRVATGETTRILPQVAFGGPPSGLNMKTVLYFTTNVATGVFGTAEIFDDEGKPLTASANGAPPASSITFTVPGNRVTRVVLSGDAVLRSGWVRLTLSASAHLVANAVFQTFEGTTVTSEASVLETISIQRGLIPVRIQSSTNVGLAVANPQTDAVSVNLTLYDLAGSVAGTREITLQPGGHTAQFVTELFPQIAGLPFDGALSVRGTNNIAPLALRLSSGKIATLPVVEGGFHRPTITGLGVSRTVRSPIQVDFSIDLADVDSDLATAAAANVTTDVYLDFGSNINDAARLTLNGAALLDRTSGRISGTFRPTRITGMVPANTPAVLIIQVYDADGNVSNLVTASFRF